MHSFGGKPGLPLMTHLEAHLSLSLLIKRPNPLVCLLHPMFNAACVAVSTMLLSSESPNLGDQVFGLSVDLIFWPMNSHYHDTKPSACGKDQLLSRGGTK